jgi:hypothetical protein
MKLQGKKLLAPKPRTVVIPRDTGNLIFTVQAVLDYKEFDQLVSMPKPPTRTYRDGRIEQVTNEPTFQKKIQDYSEKKVAWLFLKALEATSGLEWETINSQDPDSWLNYTDEMLASGLTLAEQRHLLEAVTQVNGLNDELIEEATKSFLAIQLNQQDNEFSQNTVQKDMPVGEPAKD